MRYILAVAILSFFPVYQYLHPGKADQPATPVAKPGILYIYLNDLTASDAWIPPLPKDEVFNLVVHNVQSYSHVQVSGIRITADSRRQTPYLSEKIICDLQPATGNLYQQSAIRSTNKKMFDRARLQAAFTTDSLMSYIDLPRTDQHTDMNGALLLAKQLCIPYDRENMKIKIVIIGDCLHDMSRTKALQPISFPTNTTIYVIGKSDEVDLQRLFPLNKVVELPVFKAQFVN